MTDSTEYLHYISTWTWWKVDEVDEVEEDFNWMSTWGKADEDMDQEDVETEVETEVEYRMDCPDLKVTITRRYIDLTSWVLP